MANCRTTLSDCFVMAPIVICSCLLVVSVRAEDLAALTADGITSVQHAGKPLLEYRSEPNPTKLYVSRWFTPAGVQVLRDSPHDHVHHHALMFAIGVDTVDFWSEVPPEKNGRQLSNGVATSASITGDGSGEVVIKQTVQWVAPNDDVLAVEDRDIRAHVGVVPHASLLTWQSTLRPSEGKDSIELTGRHYFGLGARFVESMDKGSRFLMPGDDKGVVVRGTERLTRALWCAVHGTADGKPVTFAMFDAPDNPRHPATWFTMTSGFAYMAATLNLHEKPLTVAAAKPLRVCYGVAVWDGTVGEEEIERAYKKWVAMR